MKNKLNITSCSCISLTITWSVARVSHPKVGMLHSPRDAFRPSLNLFSGHVMFCTPVASSEMKTTFKRCVIHLNHMSNSMHLFFHWWVPQCLASQLFAALLCLRHYLSRRCPQSCKGSGGETVQVFSAACYIVSKSHSHRARKKWQLPYALIKFSA